MEAAWWALLSCLKSRTAYWVVSLAALLILVVAAAKAACPNIWVFLNLYQILKASLGWIWYWSPIPWEIGKKNLQRYNSPCLTYYFCYIWAYHTSCESGFGWFVSSNSEQLKRYLSNGGIMQSKFKNLLYKKKPHII